MCGGGGGIECARRCVLAWMCVCGKRVWKRFCVGKCTTLAFATRRKTGLEKITVPLFSNWNRILLNRQFYLSQIKKNLSESFEASVPIKAVAQHFCAIVPVGIQAFTSCLLKNFLVLELTVASWVEGSCDPWPAVLWRTKSLLKKAQWLKALIKVKKWFCPSTNETIIDTSWFLRWLQVR